MEYSSKVYKSSIWPFSPMESSYMDKIDGKTILDYMSHFFIGKPEIGTTVISERGKSSTQSIAIGEKAESYVDIQEMIDGIIAPQSEVKKKLEEIAMLNTNWNEHGAESFSPAHIERVSRMIDSLPVAPDVYPTAIGAIQIEYQKKDGSYLEFEIYENSVNQYMIDKDGKEYEKTITDLSRIHRDVVQAVVDFYE